MKKLATNSGGKQFYISQIEAIKKELIENDNYVPTEKSTINIVPLVEFKILLALIVFAFAAEWIVRKYNGLI